MVAYLMDQCHICSTKNINTRFFHILVHHFGNYVVCDDDECRRVHAEKIMRDELQYNVFISYNFRGIVNNIKIPRTDGSFSIGKIIDRQSLDDYLFIIDEVPQLRVEFNELADTYTHDASYISSIYRDETDTIHMQYTKHIDYTTLSLHNLHLPMVHIPQRCFTNTELNAEFVKKQRTLYDMCAYTNQATKMILMSWHQHRNVTYFDYLPRELLLLIIRFYFS